MKGLLKFITCGSVDDGKSTLIGHILYDAKLLYADQEKALELDSKVGSTGGAIDYSLLLDGLMAEREQGITIDVAYRYFTTDHRSFIVADTPGHEEYTRNMAVGASFADLAVILVDASQGLLVQTRRHARICALMGIRHFVFAVNKMDLVGYSEARFRAIEEDIQKLSAELSLGNYVAIPVSATVGDNVTARSDKMLWYTGPVLLEHLEDVDVSDVREQGFYLPVQRVCRPDHTFRGFQGQIEAGTLSVGDNVRTLPSGEQAHIKAIYIGNKAVQQAQQGDPVNVQLDKEVDVSRGCVLENGADLKVADTLKTTLLWMDNEPLTPGKDFFVKLGTKLIPGTLNSIEYAIDVNTGEHKAAASLSKNEIALCTLSFVEPIVLDTFAHHRTLGELILIDRITNMTSACGVVTQVGSGQQEHSAGGAAFDTRLLHGSGVPLYEHGATLPGISQSSAFAYPSAEKLEQVFAGRAPGFAYTRIGNPTVAAFEQRINALEGGVGAVACASGMAAVTVALLNVLRAGDELIAANGLFGGTLNLLRDLENFGIVTRYVDELTPEKIAPLVNGHTRAVFGEVISNPALQVVDIAALAAFVHSKDLPLFVDSTTATPYLVNPLKLGADVVIHSSSKYINGSGDAVSGVIVDGGSFRWDAARYPGLAEYQKFGRFAYLSKLRNGLWQELGGCLSPMNAYLNVVGLETLGLRMERICSNAHALAAALSGLDGVAVNYPTLPDAQAYDLAQRQFGGKGGGILTLRAGSKERAYALINRLKYARIATNIGDVRTLVIHPASTIYLHSTPEAMHAAGVFEDTIRVSVGIEAAADLIADFTDAIKSL